MKKIHSLFYCFYYKIEIYVLTINFGIIIRLIIKISIKSKKWQKILKNRQMAILAVKKTIANVSTPKDIWFNESVAAHLAHSVICPIFTATDRIRSTSSFGFETLTVEIFENIELTV